VIHLDLKARNVLIDTNNILKLADFGLSMKLKEDILTSRQFSTSKGTFTHMAPEMIDSKYGKWGRKVDIWFVSYLDFFKDS
jgi:serine/threonine protein kinase